MGSQRIYVPAFCLFAMLVSASATYVKPKCSPVRQFTACKTYVTKGYYSSGTPGYYSPCCNYVRKESLDCLCAAANSKFPFSVDVGKALGLAKKCGKYYPRGTALKCKPVRTPSSPPYYYKSSPPPYYYKSPPPPYYYKSPPPPVKSPPPPYYYNSPPPPVKSPPPSYYYNSPPPPVKSPPPPYYYSSPPPPYYYNSPPPPVKSPPPPYYYNSPPPPVTSPPPPY